MKRLIGFSILATLFALVLMMAPVFANVNDFVIHDFYGRYELSNDTHGGRMRVEEKIDLTFSDQNHGILRAIPRDYQGRSVNLKITSVSRDGEKEPYTTYRQANNEVLKIGRAEMTITGRHVYEIEYELKNVINFQDGFDEWYWDINGDQWQQPFERVSGEVIFPEGWKDMETVGPACYTGRVGSTESFCTLEPTGRGYKFSTYALLKPGETVTIAIPAEKGLFTPRDRGDWFKENWWQLVGLAFGVGAGFYFMNTWRKYGKDYKGRGVIVPEYEAPKHLTPAEIGLLMDYNVDGKDLSATIIDLAVRGYIRIHDEQKKRLGLFNKREFSLELTNDDFSKLKPYERELLEALFTPHIKGTFQPISKISRTTMYTAVMSIRKQLKDKLTKEYGYIDQQASSRQIWMFVAAGVLFFALMISQPGWGWIVGLIWAIGNALFYALLMRRRSHAGVEMYEKVKGLQLYMDTAEKDRLKMLQSVDRPYAEPAKTVKLFEKLLPFAVALGVEKTWAKQFEGVYQQPPNWYSGNFSTFHMANFANSLTSGVSAMNSSFSASTSSSSSGSGGGGFSGGGGGGGGGGGW